jgi:nucleotide-binding universal stress UspA family protein
MEKNKSEEYEFNKVILVPTDFSEVCDNAIHHGAEMAVSLKFKLCLVHIINKETKSFMKKENLTEEDIKSRLQNLANGVKEQYKIEVDSIVREGSIFVTIEEISTEVGANLIILGTHGKVGFQHIMGSFALKVVSSSHVPVIVVQKRDFGHGYKNIVLPVSNDFEARQKVQWATLIAKTYDSKVHILRIHESNFSLDSRLKIITNQITEEFDKQKVKYEVTITEKGGNFAKQVINYAVENKADLIAAVTKRDQFLPEYTFEPWSEKMMFNSAQIPVMCINPVELGNYYYEWFTLY